jgi:nucleotide-binding universal stress UspA family protein
LESILRQCPGAAIVIPGLPPSTAKSVIVAYDGSIQASRALKSFIASGFLAESPIRVVAFDQDLAAARQFATMAADLLKRHDYDAIASPGTLSSGTPAAEFIHAACEDQDAQLLVMGAYGKPSIREFFFGTQTKRLLDQVRIPIFLDH